MAYPYFNYQYGQQIQQPVQQSPFVTVRNEMEARNYPVAFGNSVMFKDETSPYVYTKTMGFSQLDKPVFEKYRLIKENPEEETPVKETPNFDNKFSEIETQIDSIWKEIEFLKDRKKRRDDEHNSNGKSIQTKSNGNAFAEI